MLPNKQAAIPLSIWNSYTGLSAKSCEEQWNVETEKATSQSCYHPLLKRRCFCATMHGDTGVAKHHAETMGSSVPIRKLKTILEE